VAAALVALSALAAPLVHAEHASWRTMSQPGALRDVLNKSWVELETGSVAAAASPGAAFGKVSAPQVRIAGATLRNLNGWSASLFVTHAAAGEADDDESVSLPDSTSINARLARRILRGTTLTLDAFNLFDRHGSSMDEFVASRLWTPGGTNTNFLVHPGERRGVRLAIGWSFR